MCVKVEELKEINNGEVGGEFGLLMMVSKWKSRVWWEMRDVRH